MSLLSIVFKKNMANKSVRVGAWTERMSSTFRRSSNQISVIELKEYEDKPHGGLEDFNNQPQNMTDRRGYGQISYTFCTNILTSNLENSPYLTGIFGLGIIVSASLLTLFFTCWPQHNVILYPDYWYEPIVAFVAVISPVLAAFVIEEARILLKAQKMLTFRSYLLYAFIRSLGSVIIFGSIYFYWVIHLGFPNPMPRTTVIHSLLATFVVAPLANWLIFPPDMKTKGNPFRKKIFFFTVLNWLRNVIATIYAILLSQPFVRHEDYQLSLGIILPVLKKLNLWCNSKFTLWAFDCDKEAAVLENVIFACMQHSFNLTIILGSSEINSLTTYILVLADTLMNGWSVRNIIQLHQQGTDAANELRNMSLKTLALKEFLEILIPSVYCLSFTGSYLGPNYEIMGGIGLDIWHHKKISNLYQKMQNILTYTTIDLFRGIVFGIMLKKFFRLDMYSAYCYVIRNHGWYILVGAAFFNQIVSGYYL